MKIPYKKSRHGITIEVKVEPKSAQRGIAGVMDSTVLKVKLTALPVDGAANRQLIEVIAEALKVKKAQISIIRGLSSKRKIVEIRGIENIS